MVTTFIKTPRQVIDSIGLSDSAEAIVWVEQDRQRLEEIFRAAVKPSGSSSTNFSADWNQLLELPPVQRSNSHTHDKWRAVVASNERIAALKDRYDAFLSDEMRAESDLLFDKLLAVENMLHGFWLVVEEASSQEKEIKAIELICQGFELIADNLPLYADWFIRERSNREMLVESIGKIADINGLNEHFNLLDYENEERQVALDCKDSILRSMKSIQWELIMISGEGNRVPFLSGSEMIYLHADSAEGKALKRIEAMESDPDIDWIIVEPDEPIDFESMRDQIASRGYKLSSENSSSGH